MRMGIEFVVTYRDGAGNGAVNKSRVFKTERGAELFIANLKQPWNFRYYDINGPTARQV